MIDSIEWLEKQRDRHAKQRDDDYRNGDWASGNLHNEWVEGYYTCIIELRVARERLKVFSDVLQQRIIVAAKVGAPPGCREAEGLKTSVQTASDRPFDSDRDGSARLPT